MERDADRRDFTDDARKRRGDRGSRRRMALGLYAVYLAFLLISTGPILAQLSLEEHMEDKYEYNLVYAEDGPHSHYDVERHNATLPGTIEVLYEPAPHVLTLGVSNIRTLVIDCPSLFADEGVDVLGPDAADEEDLYIQYFLERGRFRVVIDSDELIEKLTFKSAPDPVSVRSDSGDGWRIWSRPSNYTVTGEGTVNIITLRAVPDGHTEVIIEFTEDEEETDTDGDGVVDSEDDDDDDDGYLDEYETEDGRTDPYQTPEDFDRDFIPDEFDPDDDNDGIPDVEERDMGTDPKNEEDFPLADKEGRKIGPVAAGGAQVTVIYSGTGTVRVSQERNPPPIPAGLETVGPTGVFFNVVESGGTLDLLYVSIDLTGIDVGTDPHLAVYYYHAGTQQWVKIPGTSYYDDGVTRTIAYEVDHLTTFALVDEVDGDIEPPDQDDESTDAAGGPPVMPVVAIIMVVLVLVIVVVVMKKRKAAVKGAWEDGEGEEVSAVEEDDDRGALAAAMEKPTSKPRAAPAPAPAPAAKAAPMSVVTARAEPEPASELDDLLDFSDVSVLDEEPEAFRPPSLDILKGKAKGEKPGRKPSSLKIKGPPSLKMRDGPKKDLRGPPSLKMKGPPSLKIKGPPDSRIRAPPSLKLGGPPKSGLRKPPSLKLGGVDNGRKPPTFDISDIRGMKGVKPPSLKLTAGNKLSSRKPPGQSLKGAGPGASSGKNGVDKGELDDFFNRIKKNDKKK